MQKRWNGKNVDLDMLSEGIEEFFRDRGFATKRFESEGERIVYWAPQQTTKEMKEQMTAKTIGTVFGSPQYPPPDLKGPITVKIVGDSNDFVIELIASELTRSSIRLGMLTKIIGGGYFLLRGLRLREALEKLETEFWVYVEDKVTHLAGSAKHS